MRAPPRVLSLVSYGFVLSQKTSSSSCSLGSHRQRIHGVPPRRSDQRPAVGSSRSRNGSWYHLVNAVGLFPGPRNWLVKFLWLWSIHRCLTDGRTTRTVPGKRSARQRRPPSRSCVQSTWPLRGLLILGSLYPGAERSGYAVAFIETFLSPSYVSNPPGMDSSAHLGASGHRIASKAGCSSVCSPHAPSSSPDVDGPSYSTSLSTTMLPSSPSSFSPCSSYESSASFSLSSSNSMQADSPSTGRKGLTHSSSWGVAATGASSPSSSPSSSNALGATALAASHSNAAAAAAKAAQSVAVLTGSKPVTAANWSKIGYSSQDQRSGHGERTGPGVCEGRALYTAQHHAGSSQRAVPPSLSSLLLSTPSFSSSNSFPAAFSTLPASPCSQPPLRRPNTQSFAAGTPCGRGVEKAGPTHLSYQHLKSPTAGVSPVPNHPILAGALAGQAAAVAASAAAAAGAAAAKAARTLTEASGTPKNAGAAQPAESKLTPPTYLKPSAGTRIGESSMKAGPVLLTSAPNTEAGRKRDLAASWLQIVCDSAAAQEGKVRRCCSNAPIQPNVLVGC